MKKIFFISFFIVTSVLSGQTLDTIKCYNAEELRRIAKGLIEKNQYDSLLEITTLENQSLYNVIYVKDIILYNTDSIIKIQNLKLSELENRYNIILSDKKKVDKKNNYLVVGLLVSLFANIAFFTTR